MKAALSCVPEILSMHLPSTTTSQALGLSPVAYEIFSALKVSVTFTVLFISSTLSVSSLLQSNPISV